MGSLLKRGVDHATASDACQEVAYRLLTKHKQFESAEHFYRWVNKVAHNLVSKWQRKDARVTVEDVPEGSSPDVVSTVEPRAVLGAAVSAFVAELSETDRQAITTALRWEDRGQTKRDRDRVSLRVLRARRRLRKRLEGWWAGLPWWRWSWSVDPAPLAAVSQAAVGAAAVTVGLLSGWLLPPDVKEPQQFEPISPSVDQPVSITTEAAGTVPAPSTTERTNTEAKITGAPASPQPPPPPDPWGHRVVVVPPADAPGTTETGTTTRDPRDNALICWGNVPHVPDTCIAHPLRRDDGWFAPQP